MAINLSFHATQKVTVRKNERGEFVWYDVGFQMNNYLGKHDTNEITIFLERDVTSLSPFEEMWQAQEAERLAEEKRINDEEDAAHAEIARVNTLEEEHIDASR